jgi:hypothetical protein
MKLQSNNTLLQNLSIIELKILTTETKETVCPNFKNKKKRNFTVADLWNIHRQGKRSFPKRFVS